MMLNYMSPSFLSVPESAVLNQRNRIIFIVLLLIFFFASISMAQSQNAALSDTANLKKKSGHYCGVYCLYILLKTAGNQINLKELLKGEYVGSTKGSYITELKKAVEDYGMYGEIVSNLTSEQLRRYPYPIILHVKAMPDSKVYDHYELFLGTKDGKAQLCDPPEPVGLVSFRELAPRWNGTGLIVSATPISLSDIFTQAYRRLAIYSLIAATIIFMVRYTRIRWFSNTISRWQLSRLSVAQGTGLAVAALLCGMIYHFANDEGFLAHPNATTSIQQAHIGNFIPKVNKKKVSNLLNTNTVFIDARYARDFKAGHIEGAINVPVDANDSQRLEIMANIAKDSRIVIYCQSAGCPFAEKVTKKLMTDGFSNISIFKGGWKQWKEKNNE
ncbi:rhodanese-like domain-containing protein [Planctomycetota bacterium]